MKVNAAQSGKTGNPGKRRRAQQVSLCNYAVMHSGTKKKAAFIFQLKNKSRLIFWLACYAEFSFSLPYCKKFCAVFFAADFTAVAAAGAAEVA